MSGTKPYENLYDNVNAEKWNLENATELLNKGLGLSEQKETFHVNGREVRGYTYDFIGEIARDLKSYHHVFSYLADQFPSIKHIHKRIKQNLEANCFFNGKRGIIKEATGIVNLKSNYNWTDRNHEVRETSSEITVTIEGEECDEIPDNIKNQY